MEHAFYRLDRLVSDLERFAEAPLDDALEGALSALADLSNVLPAARREVQNLLDEIIYGQEREKR